MITVHFFTPRTDKTGPTLGPFSWLQVTYEELRCGPDGEPIAHFDLDGWRLVDDDSNAIWTDYVIALASEQPVYYVIALASEQPV